jgi:diguanylate cyclase (GGDEF)-like protein
VERDQDDNAIAVSGSLVDVTHLVQTETTIIDDAFQDRLTGLPNRKALMIRLKRAVDQMQREPTLFAVIFLNLDRFKIINDSHGHLVGDQLLAAAASRLRGYLRKRTGNILARFRGDEFVALLEDIRTAEDVLVAAGRCQKALQKPFQIGGHEILTVGSIGIAFNNTHIEKADDLLSNADTAMYKAKARGKGELQVFNTDMHKEVTRAYALENDLGRALSRNGFFCSINRSSLWRRAESSTQKPWCVVSAHPMKSSHLESSSRLPKRPKTLKGLANGCCVRRSSRTPVGKG